MVYIRCDISFLHVSHDLYSCSLIHIKLMGIKQVEQSLLDSTSRPNVLGVSVDNKVGNAYSPGAARNRICFLSGVPPRRRFPPRVGHTP